MNTPAQNQPRAAGQAAHTQLNCAETDSIGHLVGFPLAFEIKRRFNSHAALVAALYSTLRSLDSLSAEVFDHHTPLAGLIDVRNASTIREARAALQAAKE